MAILMIMAIPAIKSTYSLDVDSVRRLEALAERWKTSKSEVIRRALKIAAVSDDGTNGAVALKALEKLQKSIRDRGVDIEDWSRSLNAERAASGPEPVSGDE